MESHLTSWTFYPPSSSWRQSWAWRSRSCAPSPPASRCQELIESWNVEKISFMCTYSQGFFYIYLETIRLKPKQQDIVIKVSRLSRYLSLFSSCSCYRHDQLLNTKCDGPVLDKWGWLGKQIRLIWSTSSAYYKIWSKQKDVSLEKLISLNWQKYSLFSKQIQGGVLSETISGHLAEPSIFGVIGRGQVGHVAQP